MKFGSVVRAAGQVLLLLIGVNSYESAQPSSGTPSLREEASQAGILIGTAVRSDQLSEQAYASTLAREFNMIEAEDAMKWWVVTAGS